MLYPSLIWRSNSDEKSLYLTFDDGPVPGPTDFALDALTKGGARATFFCIGDNIAKHPQIFRRILANIHTVANHTVNHLNGWRTPNDRYLKNVFDFDVIASRAGFKGKTDLFRPPYGRITRQQIRLLSVYRIVMWDVLTQDYNNLLSPERCLRRTINACREGSIVVFHDSYKSEKNMEYVLPRLIDHFGSKGFTFKAL